MGNPRLPNGPKPRRVHLTLKISEEASDLLRKMSFDSGLSYSKVVTEAIRKLAQGKRGVDISEERRG